MEIQLSVYHFWCAMDKMWSISPWDTPIDRFIDNKLLFRGTFFMQHHLIEMKIQLLEYPKLMQVCVKHLVSLNVYPNRFIDAVKYVSLLQQLYAILVVDIAFINDALNKHFGYLFISYYLHLHCITCAHTFLYNK